LVVAVVIAVGVHGVLLMGFDQMTSAAQASASQIAVNVKERTFMTRCALQPKHESQERRR
jgi:hypothetical protein